MDADRVPGMAEAIEDRMTQRGLTPSTFAQSAGLTMQGLADVRAGKRKRYQRVTTLGVARALRWPADWYQRMVDGQDPEAFPEVEHPDAPTSPEERLSAVESGLRRLAEDLAALSAEVRRSAT